MLQQDAYGGAEAHANGLTDGEHICARFALCFLHVGAAYALLAVPTNISLTACKQGLNEAALLNVTPTPGLVHDSNLLLLRVLS